MSGSDFRVSPEYKRNNSFRQFGKLTPFRGRGYNVAVSQQAVAGHVGASACLNFAPHLVSGIGDMGGSWLTLFVQIKIYGIFSQFASLHSESQKFSVDLSKLL